MLTICSVINSGGRFPEHGSGLLLDSVKEPFDLVVEVIVINSSDAVESVEFIVMATNAGVGGGRRVVLEQETVVAAATRLGRGEGIAETDSTLFSSAGLTGTRLACFYI